jgi:hypothetical protein
MIWTLPLTGKRVPLTARRLFGVQASACIAMMLWFDGAEISGRPPCACVSTTVSAESSGFFLLGDLEYY